MRPGKFLDPRRAAAHNETTDPLGESFGLPLRCPYLGQTFLIRLAMFPKGLVVAKGEGLRFVFAMLCYLHQKSFCLEGLKVCCKFCFCGDP